MIGSRFAIVTEDLVICCYQVTKICGSRYGFAIASSAWGPCNFGPFTDLAISVFREVSMNIVFNQILTPLCSRKNMWRKVRVLPKWSPGFEIHIGALGFKAWGLELFGSVVFWEGSFYGEMDGASVFCSVGVCWVQCFGFRVQGLGFRVQGFQSEPSRLFFFLLTSPSIKWSGWRFTAV